MSAADKRTVVEQMPAWMGNPVVVVLVVAFFVTWVYYLVVAVVSFTTWTHLLSSAAATAVTLWIFLLTFAVWRRERRRRSVRT